MYFRPVQQKMQQIITKIKYNLPFFVFGLETFLVLLYFNK